MLLVISPSTAPRTRRTATGCGAILRARARLHGHGRLQAVLTRSHFTASPRGVIRSMLQRCLRTSAPTKHDDSRSVIVCHR